MIADLFMNTLWNLSDCRFIHECSGEILIADLFMNTLWNLSDCRSIHEYSVAYL